MKAEVAVNNERLRRWGIVGLVLLAVAAVVYFFTRSQKNQRAKEIPPNDRG